MTSISSRCQPGCEVTCPQPCAYSTGLGTCVASCGDSTAVVYAPPVVVTFPGPIFSSCPQESIVGSSFPQMAGALTSSGSGMGGSYGSGGMSGGMGGSYGSGGMSGGMGGSYGSGGMSGGMGGSYGSGGMSGMGGSCGAGGSSGSGGMSEMGGSSICGRSGGSSGIGGCRRFYTRSSRGSRLGSSF